MRIKISRSVAGERDGITFSYAQNQVVDAPENIARVLCNSGKAVPIDDPEEEDTPKRRTRSSKTVGPTEYKNS